MTTDQSNPTFPYVADIAFQAGDIVFATDRLGAIVYWNREAEVVSGYTASEVLGKPYAFTCRMEPEDKAPNLSAIIAGRDFAGGVRCYTRNGDEFALYLFATLGRTPTGDPGGVVFVGRDVTGIWRAEAAFQATADKYRVLFENTLDAVVIADLDGTIGEANPAWLRLYGYTAEDIKGLNLTDVVAPEDRSAATEAMTNLAAGRLVNKTIRMRRKDGTRFVVDLVASVIVVGGKRRIMSATRDVTDRVRAEQARGQSERMYRAVFESANDAVFIEAVSGRVLDVNRHGCELLGYTRDELVQMNVADLVTPDARPWLARVTDAILRDGTFRAEAVRVHRDGHSIPVEISASTMELDGKTVVLSILRDVTERRNAERALRESEEKFRSVCEQSPNMIFINRRGRVAYANQKSADAMGYTRAEFYAPDFDFMKLIAPESADHIKSVYARHVRGEEVAPYEYSLVTKDGRRIDSIITTRLIEYDGDKAILGIVTDITERKAAEQALRESEEKFRSVAEQSPNMIFINRGGRVVYANQESSALTGYPREELYAPDFDFMKLVAPESVDKVRSVYARHVRGEETEPYPHTLLAKDGRRIESLITTKLIEYDGAPAILGIVTDITERVRADRALREEKERSQTYLALAGAMLVALDAAGCITMLNRRGCQVLGVDEAAALGRNWFDSYVPERCRSQVKATFASLMAGVLEPLESYENPVLTAAGEERLVVWHNAILRDAQGKPTGTLSSGEDVTERERAIKALRESEEKYRSVVERASDGICVVRDGRVLYLNQRLAEMVGYDPEEMVGKRFDAYLHPEDRRATADRYRRRLAGEAVPSTYPVRILTGGGELAVEVNVGLAAFGGAPAEIVLVRDVTERRNAERALRESEENFRSMAASLQDGVATLDTAGRFTFVNEVTVRRSGHPLDWWLGRHHTEVVPVEERERLERIFAAVLRKEKVDPYELAYPTADGRTVNIEATAAPITRNGEVVGVATVNRDVTERRRLVRAARETADELRAVLDNSPDAIAGECDGVLAYANQRFARLFGYDSAAEVIGRSAVEFDAPEDRELLAGYTRLREQGKDAPASYSFRGLRRDGTTMPLNAVISTYRSLGRLHILAFIREVTAGGGTEPVPGAGEERHRRPADAAPEGLMVIQNEVVVLANRAAAEMLGYTHPTELVGMRGTNLVASEDLPRLMGRGALVSTGAGGFGPLMVRFAVRGGASIPAEVIGASTSWRGKAAIQVMVKPLSVARA